MRYGIHFIPTVGPTEKSAAQYFDECLSLCDRADQLGYSTAKISEHYFFTYGGYCPDPVAFLSAAARTTKRLRLATGAILPSFSHPIKVAGQLAQLDNISHGRLEAGFGLAFSPDEFDAFQVSLTDSRARFEESLEAIKVLWTAPDKVEWHGKFFNFGPLTMLPRPVQQPHPPVWVTATFTPELFDWAGRRGYNLMLIPFVSTHENVSNLVSIYRKAWRSAGHPPGAEQVQLSLHCYVADDGEQARDEAKGYFEDYSGKLLQAVGSWSNRRAEPYPGYENIVQAIRGNSYEHVLRTNKVLIGSPKEVAAQVAYIWSLYGEFEPSLQVNFGAIPYDRALRSLELFARQVVPTVKVPIKEVAPLLEAARLAADPPPRRRARRGARAGDDVTGWRV